MLGVEISPFISALDGASVLALAAEWLARASQWVREAYAEAPAVVFGVGLALVLPAIATTGSVVRLFMRPSKPQVDLPGVPRTLPPSGWRQKAWLEMADRRTNHFMLGQGLVRIGRESDNDLCLSDATVHRYHAVIERTPEAEFILSYVGGGEDGGLPVNGRPVSRHRLRDGDVLEVGAIKLRFALADAFA